MALEKLSALTKKKRNGTFVRLFNIYMILLTDVLSWVLWGGGGGFLGGGGGGGGAVARWYTVGGLFIWLLYLPDLFFISIMIFNFMLLFFELRKWCKDIHSWDWILTFLLTIENKKNTYLQNMELHPAFVCFHLGPHCLIKLNYSINNFIKIYNN